MILISSPIEVKWVPFFQGSFTRAPIITDVLSGDLGIDPDLVMKVFSNILEYLS